MLATSPDKIKEVLGTFSKRQRIGLRQEFGSQTIQAIRHDEDDGFVIVQLGSDRPIVQHTFFIRKTGKVVHKKTSQTYSGWSGKWSKK